ncbi:MAG: hypothetical protein J6P06_03295 [Aeriscardovia sp.]|nr:hypothetical protein [Aeriscardovia sp.]
MPNYGENYQSSQAKYDALYAELKAAYVKFQESDTPCIVAEDRLHSSQLRVLKAENHYEYTKRNLESAQAKLNVAQAQVNRNSYNFKSKALAAQYDADVIKEKLEKTEKKLKSAREKFKKYTGNKSMKARDRYNAILAKCDAFRDEYETFQTEYDAAKNELDSSETEYDAALGRLQTAIINWEATESKSNAVYYKWNEFNDAFNRCRTAWANWKSACSQEDAEWNKTRTKSGNFSLILSRMDKQRSLVDKYSESLDRDFDDSAFKYIKYKSAARKYIDGSYELRAAQNGYETAFNNLVSADDKKYDSCLDWENSKNRCYAAWNNWDAAKN